MNVAFIGLGAMGRPMAKRLQAAGCTLAVFDVSQEAVNDMCACGATAASSPAQAAAGADIICTSLPNSAILQDVLLGQEGVIHSARSGSLIVDLSSVEPHVSQSLAACFAEKGVKLIDAPVSGGVSGAQAGTLTIMAGGSEADVAQAEAVLKHLAKKVVHIGPVGSGQAMKLVNNLLLGINMAAVAEALTLGTKLGLKAETMLEVIGQSSGRSYALEAKAAPFIFKRNFAPGFAVELQYKDLELAVSTAKKMTVPLLLGNLCQQIYEIAKGNGQGREDISSIIKFYEVPAQTQVKS